MPYTSPYTLYSFIIFSVILHADVREGQFSGLHFNPKLYGVIYNQRQIKYVETYLNLPSAILNIT